MKCFLYDIYIVIRNFSLNRKITKNTSGYIDAAFVYSQNDNSEKALEMANKAEVVFPADSEIPRVRALAFFQKNAKNKNA